MAATTRRARGSESLDVARDLERQSKRLSNEIPCRDRSIENRVFTITANRTGEEDGAAGRLRFPGQSQIVSSTGELLVSSNETATEWRVCEIDPSVADDKRLAGIIDMFAARRPELYADLQRTSMERSGGDDR